MMLFINGKNYSISRSDLRKCMLEDSEKSLVIFLYDLSLWEPSEEVRSVYVCGSFTEWVEKPDFEMHFSDELRLFYLCIPVSKIKGIGNSGHPEYKFCVNGLYVSLEGKDFIEENYVFPSADKNLLVLFSTDNLCQVAAQNKIAGSIKSLSDFDLDVRSGMEEISNFRLVPGTKKLFRSFHPFYSTGGRSQRFETEKTRLEIVKKLAAQEGIKSDINLSEDYTSCDGEEVLWHDGSLGKIEIPAYYKKIIESACVCNVISETGLVPSYEYVYTKTDSPVFAEWVWQIVRFIIDFLHPAPFLIHCAIGTDRTGVFCAVLAGLCGANWEEIVSDYEKTNRMGIREYRSKELLSQAFKNLLGEKKTSEISDLQKSLREYFTSKKKCGKYALAESELDRLIEKLC